MKTDSSTSRSTSTRSSTRSDASADKNKADKSSSDRASSSVNNPTSSANTQTAQDTVAADAVKTAADAQRVQEAQLRAQTQPLPSAEAAKVVGQTPCLTAPAAAMSSPAAPKLRGGLSNTAPTASHVVQPGEHMTGIAAQHNVSVNDLTAANPQVKNPNVIHPDQVLSVPGTGAPQAMGVHTVKPGEHMTGIAEQHGVELNDLVAANPQVKNPDLIHPDQQLNVPLSPAPAAHDSATHQPAAPAIDDVPVAPSGLDAPTVSGAPEAPATPGMDGAPIVDTAAPSAPDVQTAAPAQPAAPAVDGAPMMPSAPTTSGAPSPLTPPSIDRAPTVDATTPSAPDVQTAAPAQPAAPAIDGAPVTPAALDAPTVSGAPDALTPPSIDGAPTVDAAPPSIPDVQTAAPAQPAAPAIDGAPMTPSALDAPTVSGAPEALTPPSIDGAPTVDTTVPAPPPAASPGVFQAPPGFDIENPPPSFGIEVNDGQGGRRSLSVSGSVSEQLGPNGEEMVNLSVGVGEARGQGVQRDLGPATIQGAVFAGESTEYSVSIPADHYREVLAGNAPFPNPGDLSTLPEGSTATLTAETFAGLSASISRGPVELGIDASMSRGTTIGLEVGADSVRVMAGPTEAFNSSVKLGAGFDAGVVGGSVEFSLGDSVRNTELNFLDIDRAEGQAALDGFVATGELPPPGAEGVVAAGTIRQLDAAHGASLSAKLDLGPLSIGGDLLGSGRAANVTEVEFTTGERELSFSLNERGVGAFATARFDAEGRRVASQIGLTLDDVSPETSNALYGHFADGQRTHSLEGQTDRFRFPRGAVHDVQVEMSAEDFTAMRDRAVEAEIARYAGSSSPLSEREVTALRAGDLEGAGISVPADRQALLANDNFFGFITDSRNGLVGAESVAMALHRAAATDPEQRGLPGLGSFYVDDPAFQ